MGLDSRARYSKMVIRDSISALVQEKPFHSISITEVCKRAEINRTTFYKYYKDMPDWKEQIEQGCLERTKDLLNIQGTTDMQDALTHQFQEMQQHADLYTMISSPNFESDVLKSIVSTILDKAVFEAERKLSSDNAKQHQKMWNCYYVIYGCLGVIECWIQEGMKEAPEVLAAYYTKHLRRPLRTIQ